MNVQVLAIPTNCNWTTGAEYQWLDFTFVWEQIPPSEDDNVTTTGYRNVLPKGYSKRNLFLPSGTFQSSDFGNIFRFQVTASLQVATTYLDNDDERLTSNSVTFLIAK